MALKLYLSLPPELHRIINEYCAQMSLLNLQVALKKKFNTVTVQYYDYEFKVLAFLTNPCYGIKLPGPYLEWQFKKIPAWQMYVYRAICTHADGTESIEQAMSADNLDRVDQTCLLKIFHNVVIYGRGVSLDTLIILDDEEGALHVALLMADGAENATSDLLELLGGFHQKQIDAEEAEWEINYEMFSDY